MELLCCLALTAWTLAILAIKSKLWITPKSDDSLGNKSWKAGSKSCWTAFIMCIQLIMQKELTANKRTESLLCSAEPVRLIQSWHLYTAKMLLLSLRLEQWDQPHFHSSKCRGCLIFVVLFYRTGKNNIAPCQSWVCLAYEKSDQSRVTSVTAHHNLYREK